MKTICYSDNKQFYWIREFASGHSYWLSVAKYPRKPSSLGWISDIIQFDNSYYRHALPFTFWKIQDRKNLKEQVDDDHELVKDYESVELNNTVIEMESSDITSDVTCPKCGSTWVTNLTVYMIDGKEKIYKLCVSCGYKW